MGGGDDARGGVAGSGDNMEASATYASAAGGEHDHVYDSSNGVGTDVWR